MRCFKRDPIHNSRTALATSTLLYPESERLYSLLRRTHKEEGDPKTLQQLETIETFCDIYQRLSTKPIRFRVNFPDEFITFNRTIYMDLMTIDKQTVLHIVDKDTKFNAASFMKDGEDAEET